MDRDVKEINSDVENPAVGRKVVERGKSVARTWAIFYVHQGPYLQRWNSIFVISCVFAVSLDPLFFYVVNIDQENKCLHTDETLKIVALVMRSVTDVIFLVHLICEISDSVQKIMDKKSGTSASKTNNPKNEPSEAVEQTRGNSGKKWEDRELIQYARKIAQNVSWLSIIIDVLALLPLPQLLILMFYPMKGSGFVEHKKFVNVFLLGQYVPRIFRIHLSAKVFKRMNGIWAKGLFNLFLYILAGHVLGAFWYFFSIQRAASCWHEACVKCIIGCNDTLCCDSGNTITRNIIRHLNQSCTLDTQDGVNTTAINMATYSTYLNTLDTQDGANTTAINMTTYTTYLNHHCPLDIPDGALSPFKFGIFLDSLKNENPEQKFGKKFLYSFWWGLRNLSNFGTNLVTSTYVWENLFAILISVIGLLLFIYLIGNVQAFMQMEATKVEDTRRQEEARRDEEMRRQEEARRDEKMKRQEEAIKDKEMRQKAAKIDEERCLCMKTLTKIPMLKDMDEKALTMMCEYLKPATYIENSFVFRTGDPLDYMLLIIEGTMWTYTPSDSHAGQGISSMAIKPLRKGEFYGEELLDWASDCFTEVPISSKHVKSQTKVEAFLLMAKDLETVVSRYKQYRDLDHFNNRKQVEEVALSTFRRFRTNAQRRPTPSPAEIGDDNGEVLPAGN